MAEQQDRKSTINRFNESLKMVLPRALEMLTGAGILGIVGAAVVMTLKSDMDLYVAYASFITGITGNLITGYLERLRSLKSDAEQAALLKELASRLDSGIDNINLDSMMLELNILGSCLDVIGSKIDRLTSITEAGFASVKKLVPLPALHQLPQPPRDFTGRTDELTKLLAAVQTNGVTISGLRGMGGVGKTALALVLAERLTPAYPDAQFYLDLRGASASPMSPVEIMTHIVRSYDTTAKLPDDEAAIRALYNSKLHGQCALLLLDNAADSAQVAGLLPPPTCLLILTSRWHFTLPGLYGKDLDTLPPPDAHALLLLIAPRIKDHAGEIAKLCGYLPQALRLTASALAERVDLSPAGYLRKLADATQRLKLTGVDASLSLSYDLLSADLQTQWRQLAVFPGDFDAAAAAAVWGCEDEAAHVALSELLRYSLVEFREVTGSEEGRYRLHDLARLFANSRLGENERLRAQYRHAVHYETVLRAAKELYKKGGDDILRGLALYDAETINIKDGQAWATAHAKDDNDCAQLCNRYPDAGVNILNIRHNPHEWIQWRQAALVAAQLLHDRDAIAVHLMNLGTAYSDLGDQHKAIDFYEKSLEMMREIPNRVGEGEILCNLGNANYILGNAPNAKEFFQQSLPIMRECSNRDGEVNTLIGLGNSHQALGDVSKAIYFYELGYKLAYKNRSYHKVAKLLGNLGKLFSDQGKMRIAFDYYVRSLAIKREIGDYRGVAISCWNLGREYGKLGDFDRAVTLMQVLVDYEREIGHPDAEEHAKFVETVRVQAKGNG